MPWNASSAPEAVRPPPAPSLAPALAPSNSPAASLEPPPSHTPSPAPSPWPSPSPSLTPAPSTEATPPELGGTTTQDPALVRLAFYATYDVMTGVRIAATLGGFFSLMVLLVLYKSKCKTKSLSDEQLDAAAEAAAEAAVEAEDRERERVLAAHAAGEAAGPSGAWTGAWASSAGGRHALPRRSLGNVSAPAHVLSRHWRHSYSMEAPAPHYLYYYQRGRSLPGSSLRFPGAGGGGGDERGGGGDGSGGGGGGAESSPDDADDADDLLEEEEEEDEEEEDVERRGVVAGGGAARTFACACVCDRGRFLAVPGSAHGWRGRRLSSVTVSSSDSSYLERRGSAVELGLPAPPPSYRRHSRRASAAMPEEPWDFYYPIDIQVIQPTPDASPCGSDRTLYVHALEPSSLLSPAPSSAPSLAAAPASTPLLCVPPTGAGGACGGLGLGLGLSLGPGVGRAPLASISSCAAPSLDYPDIDLRSVGSDSVFLDDAELLTEDEVDGLSSDSSNSSPPSPPGPQPQPSAFTMHFLQVPCAGGPAGAAGARWGSGPGVGVGSGSGSRSGSGRRRMSAPSVPRSPRLRSSRPAAPPSAPAPTSGLAPPPTAAPASPPAALTRRPPLPLPDSPPLTPKDYETAAVSGADGGDSSPSGGSCCSLGPSDTSSSASGSGSATLRGGSSASRTLRGSPRRRRRPRPRANTTGADQGIPLAATTVTAERDDGRSWSQETLF